MINLVVATDRNGVIGKDNKLPWGYIKEDMWRFRKITKGKIVVMGRKTFESIGKPLKDRVNIVLTRNVPDTKVCIEEDYTLIFMNDAEKVRQLANYQDVYVIGGEEIYRIFLPYAEMIYLTEVQATFEGDAYFPNLTGWEWVKVREYGIAKSEGNPYACVFYTLVRK